MASKYPAWSPYNFVMNNLINLIDPNGDSVNVAAFMRRHQDQWQETKSDLEELGGLKLGTSKSGNITYEINEDAEGYSETARNKMIASFSDDKQTVNVASFNGRRSYAEGNDVILSMSQINGFINNTSEGLSSKTLGYGMTFLDELGHTDLGGSMKDFDAFGGNGSNVSQMNKIRSEMSQSTSTNWGERYYHARSSWNTTMFVMPFSKNTKTMLDQSGNIMGPHILTPNPKF
jgi:hypothetical protein